MSDLSPLAGLTSLTNLDLHMNGISGLSPLVENQGLGEGDSIDVRRNPLSAESLNEHVPVLQQRGVSISFDEPVTTD